MSDELKRTVKISRGSELKRDDRGRNVWTGPVEEVEFELVSTVMLKQLLQSDDEKAKQDIRDKARAQDGLC